MAAIITVDRLSKRYYLSHAPKGQRTLREEITRWASNPLRWLSRRPSSAPSSEEFWALKDLSFDIQPGEVVGVIGRNGAGKSTLLKILSRITEPTEGRVEISGRVASLLEVGTGFHPELTGRENVFLNGAILGMTRVEIRKKFDEIVAFAEVERFLDTPVKRYSSGMYVRLAFAVAAHLEPEILVVDEVLAVGDHQFQQKCLGKMQDVSRNDGRTVLFVSHQMGTVRQLCSRAIHLNAGRLVEMGPTNKIIDSYLGSRTSVFTASASSLTKDIAVEAVQSCTSDGEATSSFVHTDQIAIQVGCRINRWVPGSELRFVLEDSRGRRIFTTDLALRPHSANERGLLSATAVIPPSFLRPGTYLASLFVFVHNQITMDSVPDAISFAVRDGGTKYAANEEIDYGSVFSPCHWTMKYSDEASYVKLTSAS